MCRQAAANGTSGYGRSDNLAQQTSLAGHSPRSGLDSDHNSVYIEKRECSAKERVNQRAVNKYVLYPKSHIFNLFLSITLTLIIRFQFTVLSS